MENEWINEWMSDEFIIDSDKNTPPLSTNWTESRIDCDIDIAAAATTTSFVCDDR